MGFLKKFKEQKQDGPDASPESGPVSTQPSIGPEDFLPPEPVPRTTRSRAKASTAPTPNVDVASPAKAKATVRGKGKEPQQPAAADAKPPMSPTPPPKVAKGKAVAQPEPTKAAASNKAASNKAGEDAAQQLDASGSASSGPATEDQVQTSKTPGARSRAVPKMAPSPWKEIRGKGAIPQFDDVAGGLSTVLAQEVEPKEVLIASGPSSEPPPPASNEDAGFNLGHGSAAGATLHELAFEMGPSSARTSVVDSAVLSGLPSSQSGTVAGGQLAVMSEADLPRDPRKRHRAQVVETVTPSADRLGAAAAATLGAPSTAPHAQPQLQPQEELPPEPQSQPHQQSKPPVQPLSSGQGVGTGEETVRLKDEAQTPIVQLEAIGVVPSLVEPESGTTATATGQVEQPSSNLEADLAALPPPPPPLPQPAAPPLPPHLAASRGQPNAAAASGPPSAGRDDASTRSAYVMVGLRESTATAPDKPSGAGGSGGSSDDRDRNRDRERGRHRHDAERTRARADRDPLERDRDRTRHQPEAGGKGTGARGTIAGHASSPSRGDKDRDGLRGDNKAAIRSRSRSRDRASKPAGDNDGAKDKDRQRDRDSSGRSEKDRERERAREKEKEKYKQCDREREKDKARSSEAASATQKEGNTVNGPPSSAADNDRYGSNQHKGSAEREKAGGRSPSRDAKRPQFEDVKPSVDVKEEVSAPAAAAAAASGSAAARDSGGCEALVTKDGDSSHRGGAGDAQAPSASCAGCNDDGTKDTVCPEQTQQAGLAAGAHPNTVSAVDGEAEQDTDLTATGTEEAGANAAGPADGAAAAASVPGSGRCKREPIVWNPRALPAVPSPTGPKAPDGAAAEAGGSGGNDHEQQLADSLRAPLSPSPRRTYSSSDSEPTRSRSRGYSSSDEEDDAGSIGKRDVQVEGAGCAAAGGVGEGEFDHAENEHEEVLLEYDFDLMEADLLEEHLDEHVRAQDDAGAATMAVAEGGSAGVQAEGAGEPAPVEHAAAEGERAVNKGPAPSGRGRNGISGRVAYEDMGAPGPDLSREQQVAHVTAGLVGQVGEDMLAKLRKLLNDMLALDLSTVRPWALRSLLAINDDEARWRASQALLSIEWSTANNPGGVLHARLQRAVEMERLALLRSGRAARVKRARSASPAGAGPAAKRADRSGDAKAGRASSTDGRRRRSGSREREGGRSRRGSSKDRGRSPQRQEARDGGSRPKSRDAEEERRRDRDRTRTGSKDRDTRDRERGPRDAGLARLHLREPDLKSRRWDDVMRATTRGCIVKLPRAFVEDARRVLYDVDGLDCSQIDANAWDPLLMLPNCEQRLNALRTLRTIRWKERFNVSATVKGTLLRCAEQVQRDMQRRDMMRPGLPLLPLGPPGLIPATTGVGCVAVGGVGALAVRRDARYILPIGALPGPPNLLGSRGLPPPPPPIPGSSGLGMSAARYPPPHEAVRLETAPSRLRDRDRDERSKQRGSTIGAAGSRGRSRSKSKSPSHNRRGASGRRSCSKARSPVKGRSKARSKSRSCSRSAARSPGHRSRSKSRSRSRGRRNDKNRASSSRSRSRSKRRSPAARRGTKRSRSPSQAPADGGGRAEEAAAEADGTASRPLSTEFKDRMYKYLKSFGKLDLSGVDDKVFECLGRLPDDSARMDCLRRLSGVQWHAVSGAQETQKRLQALLERGTNELLKGHGAPSKMGYTSGSKRRTGGGGSGRR